MHACGVPKFRDIHPESRCSDRTRVFGTPHERSGASFRTTAYRPPYAASSSFCSVSVPETNTIRVCGSAFTISAAASIPLMPGIEISTTTRSGRKDPARAIAGLAVGGLLDHVLRRREQRHREGAKPRVVIYNSALTSLRESKGSSIPRALEAGQTSGERSPVVGASVVDP